MCAVKTIKWYIAIGKEQIQTGSGYPYTGRVVSTGEQVSLSRDKGQCGWICCLKALNNG